MRVRVGGGTLQNSSEMDTTSQLQIPVKALSISFNFNAHRDSILSLTMGK